MNILRRFVIGSASVLAATSVAIAQDEDGKKYDSLGSISGIALSAIEAAKPDFEKLNPDRQTYTVDVVETDHRYLVSFCLKSQEQTIIFTEGTKEFGRWPRCPGSLTVELNKDFTVAGKHFNRD